MSIEMTEYYKNIPCKKCIICGKDLVEQHESYINKCGKCLENVEK